MKRAFRILSIACYIVYSQSATADHRSVAGFTAWGDNRFDGNYAKEGFYRPRNSGHFDEYRWNRPNRLDRRGNSRVLEDLPTNSLYPIYRSVSDFWGIGRVALIGGLGRGSSRNQASVSRSTIRVGYRYQPVRARSIISTGQAGRSRSVISSIMPHSALVTQNGRRLQRDIDGRCFERAQNIAGEALRIELDPAECAFSMR